MGETDTERARRSAGAPARWGVGTNRHSVDLHRIGDTHRGIRLDRVPRAGLFGAVALVLLVGGLNVWNAERVYRANEWVDHTNAVRTSLDELLLAVVDAETGERGYLITGLSEYLEPYEASITRMDSALARLGQLVPDNPDQVDDLATLRRLTQDKRVELQDTIEVRRDRGAAEANARVLTSLGKQLMDEVRSVVARMSAREADLLAVRRADAVRRFQIAVATSLGSTSVAVVALVALFVSLRRRAEERLRALEVVDAQRESLEVTLLGIGDGVVVCDRDGVVSLVNPVAEALTGFTALDAVGRPVEEVFTIVNETTRATVPNPARTALHTGEVQALANHTVLISRDGSERPIDDSGAPIRTPEGGLVGAVLIFRDVSQQRQKATALEAALAEAEASQFRLEVQQRELREAVRTRDQFLATVSHELRTPINAIVGWADMLSRKMLRPERVEAAIGSIDRNARSLANLIENLLDTARLVSGKMAMAKSAVQASGLVLDAVESVRMSAEQASVDLRVHMPQETLTVWGDPERLKQVMLNLLVNAIKFTPPDGQVGVHVSRQDDCLRLEVRDTGVGVAAEFLPHIFAPFMQGESAGPLSGLGLGLSIARDLVELHGGRIDVESQGAGQGTTFVVLLPLMTPA